VDYYEQHRVAQAEAAAAVLERKPPWFEAEAVGGDPLGAPPFPSDRGVDAEGGRGVGALRHYRYYREVAEELEQLFSSFPPEETLTNLIGGSYFARINYVGDKFYAVGLITENDEPQYICYAVPGRYSPEPPEELRNCCRWLPAKYTDYAGAGYWVMYQDVDSGATVTDILL
jgi:hypothetical protein